MVVSADQSKSPIRKETDTEELTKYPLYHRLKLARLGLRPKRLTVASANRIIEEIYNELSTVIRRNQDAWDQNADSFSTHVHKFFVSKFSSQKNNLRSCESVILNFMYSIDSFKNESPHCLLFGQLLAELFTGNVSIFVAELRSIIQDECGFKILQQLEKKNGIEQVKVPVSKLKPIISKFVTRKGFDSGVEAFMEHLKEKFPTVSIG